MIFVTRRKSRQPRNHLY